MKLDFAKEKKNTISLLLLTSSVLLGILILIKLTAFFVTSGRQEKLIDEAALRCRMDPNATEKYLAKSKETAEQLKKKNLFAPPPPKQHPVSEISGILGNEVLIKDKWYKVGDKIADAEILAIEPAQVKIKWDGKEKYFAPIAAAGETSPDNKPENRPDTKNKQAAPATVAQAQAQASPEPVTTAEEDIFAWMAVKLSDQARAKLLETWNKLTDEQKEDAKKEWGKMSDEQKQQAVDHME
jgi:hypothetical protein